MRMPWEPSRGDPAPGLASAAKGLLAGGERPPLAGSIDPAAIDRSLAAASARFGRMRLGLPVAGDGRTGATWALVTERGGDATLRLGLDPETGEVAAFELLVAPREPPAEAW